MRAWHTVISADPFSSVRSQHVLGSGRLAELQTLVRRARQSLESRRLFRPRECGRDLFELAPSSTTWARVASLRVEDSSVLLLFVPHTKLYGHGLRKRFLTELRKQPRWEKLTGAMKFHNDWYFLSRQVRLQMRRAYPLGFGALEVIWLVVLDASTQLCGLGIGTWLRDLGAPLRACLTCPLHPSETSSSSTARPHGC